MDMSKSSRRKQTKPIRVYEGEEAVGSDQTPPTQGAPENFTNGSSQVKENGPEQTEDMPVDLHVAIITCTKCPETFPSKEHFMNHLNAVHASAKEPKIDTESMMYNYPTAYHRLGSELQLENKIIANGHAEGESENIPPETQNIPEVKADAEQKDLNGDHMGVVKDGNRIFHPDAYCELCDREFCNKYFLKTHKANKHGIYENAPSPFSMTPGQTNMILPPQEPVLPSPYKHEPAPTPSQPLPPKKEAVAAVPKSFKLDATAVKVDTTSLTSSKPAASEIKPVTSGSSTQPDMEDYCEICQKHFCNKYYLKKHKQDVHGIVPENSPSSSGKRSRAAFDIPITATVTSSPMILPQTMANMAGLPNMPNMPGVMVLNPFMPPVAIIPAQSLLPQQQVHPQPHSVVSQPLPVSLPALPHSDQVPVSLQSSMSYSPMSSAVSLTATLGKPTPSIPNDALRSIGVLNAEAYCEQCRKEFCNKYFLKIHMANKHGVFSDDMIPPPYGKSMDALENSMLSPVKIPKEVKQEPGSQISPPGTAGGDSYVTFCNLCNKEFSSKYSYKIHRMNVHGMLNECLQEPSLADGPEIPMSKIDSIAMSSSEGLLKVAAEAQAQAQAQQASAGAKDNSATTIFGNMIAAKLADRVVCDICNKELCNKYFLKAHKLRIHGVDLSPQEKAAEAERENPYDSPYSKSGLSTTPKSEAKDLSAITAEMITADILQRSQVRSNASKKLDLSNIAPNLPSEKPSNEELVKLGIDPEAYCEICKKEFCSKYFLRTHRLNIHGIRTEKSDPDTREKERSKQSKSSLFNQMNGFGLGGLGVLGGLGGLGGFMGGMHGGPNGIFSFAGNGGLLGPQVPIGTGSLGGPGSLSPMMPELARHDQQNSMRSHNGGVSGGTGGSSAGSASSSSSGSGSKSKDGFQKHTWRWKEPVNSSRVACEICNKELCNKYFLRTHKLNKHGIIPSDKSPSMGSSPAPSDCETASNASSQPDQAISDRGNQTPVSQNSKIDSISPHPSPTLDKSFEKSANQLKADLLRLKNEEELNNRYINNQYSEVCNLCDRRFKSSRWLKAHILKDHAGWPMMDMFDPKTSGRTGLLETPDPKACTVCGLVFPSELSMQLHLIQEHNAQVTLKTEESQQNGNGESGTPPSEFGYGLGFRKRVFRADKQKLYACVLCDYKTKWLSNLTSHEMKIHNLSKNSKLCPKSFPSELLLSRHVEPQLDEPLDISRSGSNKKIQEKRYKCSICGDKFDSRVVCNRHLREVHIRRKKNFASRNMLHRSRYSCSQCSYSTRYPQQLQRHRSRFHASRSTGGPLQEWKGNLEEVHAEPITKSYTASAQVQCFELAVNTPDSTFLPSLAHMPVRQRVSEPMAVTFILTPVNP